MEIKKNRKAQLEGMKKSFFLMGTLASLSIILMAFEWTNTNITRIAPELLTEVFLDDEKIFEREIVKPTPPKPYTPPKVSTLVKVVPVVIEVDTTIVLFPIDSALADNLDNGDLGSEDGSGDDTLVLQTLPEEWAEHMPEYPGGEKALYKHLSKKIKFTECARVNGITGTVYVSFVIEKDGSITDVKIIRGLECGLNEVSIKAVKTMKNWKPGRNGIEKVRFRYKLPIRYKLN